MTDPVGTNRPPGGGWRPGPRLAGILGLGGVVVLAVGLIASGGLLGDGGGLGRPGGAPVVTSGAGRAATSPQASDSGGASVATPIRIGAVFPLTGDAASLAKEELLGVQLAADFVNADGGVAGRKILLDVRDLESAEQAPQIMGSLRAEGAAAVVGAYSSDLSLPASTAANAAGLVYWEAGAVADRLTGRGLPLVFRVGASGTNLGRNSAEFAATQLAPRLHKSASKLRLAIVSAGDDYAASVANAAARTARAAGVPIVADTTYNLVLPNWPQVMRELATSHPDVIVLASHIPDGIAFRRAMLAAGLKAGALIGSTMAECSPDFAGDLGKDAVGIFASDRPTGGFQPGALRPDALSLYRKFASAWAERAAPTESARNERYSQGTAGSDTDEYKISGPDQRTSGNAKTPTEEGLAGFSAAWALFHDVLPAAAQSGGLDATGIATAARSLDLPTGSLPNGAGIRFSNEEATLGQNERAAAVIWQWQAVRSYTFVWPPTYATGSIGFVPLSR